VLRRIFNWVRSKLVSCPVEPLDPTAVDGGVEEDIDTVGE
jgi:hypothetical protein